jgi:hypothetical protein
MTLLSLLSVRHQSGIRNERRDLALFRVQSCAPRKKASAGCFLFGAVTAARILDNRPPACLNPPAVATVQPRLCGVRPGWIGAGPRVQVAPASTNLILCSTFDPRVWWGMVG